MDALMKSNIILSVITVLAALALAGCDQSTPGSTTSAKTTNSNMSSNAAVMGGITNMPPASVLPIINTNLPAGTNQ